MKNLIPQFDGKNFYESEGFWTALVSPLVVTFLPYILHYVPVPVNVDQATVIAYIVAAILGLVTHKVVRVLKAR